MADLTLKEMSELVTEIHMERENTNLFCNGCILLKPGSGCLVYPQNIASNMDEIQKRLKEYKESKKMTYKKDFLSKFPNAPLFKDGRPKFCRVYAYGDEHPCINSYEASCKKCWNEELSKVGESL